MSRPLALTLGEPAGIGPDITLAAWRRRAELDLPPFYLLADPQCLARRAERLGLDVPIELVDARDAPSPPSRAPCRWSRSTSPATAEPGTAGRHQRAGRDRLDRSRGRRRARRRGRRRRHQSGRQERALPVRLRRSRPHRISRQAVVRADRRSGLAGDDAVVAGGRGRAGHHPPAAARRCRSG